MNQASQDPENEQSKITEKVAKGDGDLSQGQSQTEKETEFEIIPTLSVLIKSDPVFGHYMCVREIDSKELSDVLRDCGIRFAMDPKGSESLSQIGHHIFVFGRQHPHYLRESLDEYEVKVRIDPGVTLPEQTYAPPLDQLLALGDPREKTTGTDFAALGIRREHAPELIRMATDEVLHLGPGSSDIVWAPVYAWRALGHFRVEDAIVPLLSLLRHIDEDGDDWAAEELPEIFADIGPAAIAPTSSYLGDTTNGIWARVAAASALAKVAQKHPDRRMECVQVLSAQLERFSEQDATLNAFIVSPLVDLHAIEAMPLMEKAFSLGKVDESILGDFEDVQIELGLKTRRETRRKPNSVTMKFDPIRKKLGLPTPDELLDSEAGEMDSDWVSTAQPYIAPPKIGRNQPCPCGSGKKYKKCCGV